MVEQTSPMENIELTGRLKLGGRWYGRSDVVAMTENDAAVLMSRGIGVRAKKGSKPKNVEQPKPETIPANQVPVQTKDEEQAQPATEATKEVGHGKRSDKKR